MFPSDLSDGGRLGVELVGAILNQLTYTDKCIDRYSVLGRFNAMLCVTNVHYDFTHANCSKCTTNNSRSLNIIKNACH
jgi:hypothetical protein